MRRVDRAMSCRIVSWMTALAFGALFPSIGWTGAPSPEKCVLAKLAASRAFTVCILKAQEKNLKKPGSANEAVCLEKLAGQWNAIEAKAGADVCPEYRRDMAAAAGAIELKEQLELGIRPPTELVLFDAGPATGEEIAGDGPHFRCSAGKPDDLVCRRTPAVVSDQSYGPASNLPTEFDFYQDIPLVSRSGVQIAADWDTFLNGTWEACLQGTAGPDCTTPAGVLPDGATWWNGFDPVTGEERSCSDWSLPVILLNGETAFIGSASTDGAAGHPSPWGEPTEVACDGFEPEAPDRPHVLCLCF